MRECLNFGRGVFPAQHHPCWSQRCSSKSISRREDSIVLVNVRRNSNLLFATTDSYEGGLSLSRKPLDRSRPHRPASFAGTPNSAPAKPQEQKTRVVPGSHSTPDSIDAARATPSLYIPTTLGARDSGSMLSSFVQEPTANHACGGRSARYDS